MENNICQSCGMPMVATEHFGTSIDGSPNIDYCCFCFKDGKFTDNLSFTDFVVDSVNNAYETVQGKDYTLSKNEIILNATIRLQELKRWKSHHVTHQEYYKAVNRVIDFINNHLNEVTSLTTLARVANISEYHFHRIFKAIMNESPGNYNQRLRLEKAAFMLVTTKLSLIDIAGQTGYQSPQALSKVFKKKFGLTPHEYKATPIDWTIPLDIPLDNISVEPEIVNILSKKVLSIRVANPYKNKDAFALAWKKLLYYTNKTGVPGEEYEYYCISRDISSLTNHNYCRIYACINVTDIIKPRGEFGIQTIDGGMYAVFTHKGSYKGLETLYCNIYRYWILNSEYQLRDTLHFEKYLNSPDLVKEEDLLTQIFIPVSHI